MSNSVNFYEFIGFITFNIEVHELVYVYSFLVDGIVLCPMFRVRLCVGLDIKTENLKTFFKNLRFLPALSVPRATVRTLKPKKPKKPKNLNFSLKNLRFLPARPGSDFSVPIRPHLVQK